MIISIWILVISFFKSSIHSYNIQKSKKSFNKRISLNSINSNKFIFLNKSQKNQINLLSEFKNNKLLYNTKNIYLKERGNYTIEIENDTLYYFYINTNGYYNYHYFVILESSKNVPFYDKYDRNLGEIYITKDIETLHILPHNYTETVKVRHEINYNDIFFSQYINIYEKNIYDFFSNKCNNCGNHILKTLAFKNNDDYAFYFNSNIGKVEVWISKYNKGMYSYDIESINKKYFTKLNDRFSNLEKDNFYILVFENNLNYTSGQYLFFPINIENISIKKNQNLVFLKENKIYNISFEDNSKKKLIKLSENTLNSTIKATINYKEIILNKENPYFEIENNENMLFKSEKSNGLIEFLYDYSYIPIITNNSFNMTERELLIKCEKLKNSGKFFIFFTNIKNELRNLNIISGYSKLPYMNYYETYKGIELKKEEDIFSFQVNIPQKEFLVENETFNIIISASNNDSKIVIYMLYDIDINNNGYGLIVLLIIIIIIFSFLILLCYRSSI